MERITAEISETVNVGGWGSYAVELRGTNRRHANAMFRWILENQSDNDGILDPSILREANTSTISFTWTEQPTRTVQYQASRVSDHKWGMIITTEPVA